MIENIIFLSAITIYALRSAIFCFGAYKERKKNYKLPEPDTTPFVSVLIPSRNEEVNIEKCIHSIAKNTYPQDKYEIIAINDRSTDKTGEILAKLEVIYTNLRVVTVSEETANKNLKGKPGALQAGIDVAKGSILLMTDADCTVEPKWIEGIARAYSDKDTGLVACYTTIDGKNIFENIQAVEWLCMHTMGTAGIGLGEPLGCYGNNMSVRTVDYNKVGGYEKIKFSVTEDLALLQAIYHSEKKIRYIPDFNTSVNTLPCKTLKEYFRQHHRWAIGGMALGWRAAVFVITSLALWIGIITAIITLQPLWLAAVVMSRVIGDYFMIIPTLRILKRNNLIPWVIPSVIFFIIAEAIIPFLLLKKDISWKGQIFKKL